MAHNSAINRLRDHFKTRHALNEAIGMLCWDQQTMMPTGASQARGETIAELARLEHMMMIDPKIGTWLKEARAERLDCRFAQANLAAITHLHTRASALDGSLVAARARAANAGEMAWREARKKSEFAILAPALSEIVRLEREAAAALGDALGLCRYDALLDGFEPGGRMEAIWPLFDDLADFIPPLREHARRRPTPDPGPTGPFPAKKQEALGRRLMKALGFDFKRGRLDVSLHPFCGGSDDDVRITTRYDENDFTSALMGVLHETGHALYELGLPQMWRDQPVGRARGMVMHESQSLLVEMQLCRSPAFFEFAAPLFCAAFAAEPSDPRWAAEGFAARAIEVKNGFIRVDADELSYPLHIILRTRLEHAMINGDLEVIDLPGAWNEGFNALFDVQPPSDAVGCLQDIHWPSGAFGYFPTYTLGAIAAAQIFAAAKRALPDLNGDIRRGAFTPLMAWTQNAIHARASLGSTDDILRQATGATLQIEDYRTHLSTRYGS